jgi:hypothetical protein
MRDDAIYGCKSFGGRMHMFYEFARRFGRSSVVIATLYDEKGT